MSNAPTQSASSASCVPRPCLAVYSAICVQCLKFRIRSCALAEVLWTIRCSKPKQARGLVFGVAVQGQFGTVEIDLAELALFGLCVGIGCRGQQRLRRRLAEKKANDRRWLFGHVDLLNSFGELARQIVARVHNVNPERRVSVFGIELARLA
jgi:hypothetical protein